MNESKIGYIPLPHNTTSSNFIPVLDIFCFMKYLRY